MNPATHRPPNKVLHTLAATALAWASPGHCAPAASPGLWAEVGSGPDIDALLMLLTALFWVVTHVWALLVVWAEARATRPAEAGDTPTLVVDPAANPVADRPQALEGAARTKALVPPRTEG